MDKHTERRVAQSDYLFRSGLIGVIILLAGMIIIDPNKGTPDYAASMVLGLIGLPMTVGILIVPIVIVLRFVFQPLVSLMQRKFGVSAVNVWLASIAVIIPITMLVPLIDGASWMHSITAGVAVVSSCIIYARKNNFA